MKKTILLITLTPLLAFSQCISGDCVNGYGTYLYDGANKGDKYVGEWKNDMRHGFGTYTFGPNSEYAGDIYMGESKNDSWNGFGTYISAKGFKYVGEWKDDSNHGVGTYIWANGDKYVGEFRDNYFHGFGSMYYLAPGQNQGDIFHGEYKDGVKNGIGTYIWQNGKGDVSYYIDDKEIKRLCDFEK